MHTQALWPQLTQSGPSQTHQSKNIYHPVANHQQITLTAAGVASSKTAGHTHHIDFEGQQPAVADNSCPSAGSLGQKEMSTCANGKR
jgi:hypothetical protein